MRLRQYVRNSVYVVCNIFFGCNGYSLVTIGLSMVAFFIQLQKTMCVCKRQWCRNSVNNYSLNNRMCFGDRSQ